MPFGWTDYRGLGFATLCAAFLVIFAATEPHSVRAQEQSTEEKDSEEDNSTAERLASANPVAAGIPWSIPINFSVNSSLRTFNPGGQLSYNPNVYLSLSVRPRWQFESIKGLSIGLRQDVDLELTDSEITNRGREPWLYDTRLDVTYTLPISPWGMRIVTQFFARAPTSKSSRAFNRIIGLGGALTAIKPFKVLSGLIFVASASYLGWVSDGNVPRVESPYPCRLASGQATNSCPTGGGNTEIVHVPAVFAGLTLLPAPKFQVGVGFQAIFNRRASLDSYRLGNLDGVISPNGNRVVEDGSATHWSPWTVFFASVGYDVLPYLTVFAQYSTLAFHPNEAGGVENPFYNENTEVGLGIQFRPAQLYGELRD